ncbi:DNA gyrase inhibitor YacG [Flagellatimonas centrodinii]|uniref:DNA gyrase inhibitor YacG n=1 Tax=Flagellatimonas centrodinii TaxID=2806210 RepID=UPI001FEE9612|nr:DNA gyrase inhibitor YacG [Flagellatimonas centrodinii]ULQ47090.1 DNA gyrase inhibitor YacG [Flagellatimonas centrodinii]
MSATPTRIGRCPQCSKASRLDDQNRWRPFCSERCKMVDLGEWFAERHVVPGEPIDPMAPQGEPERWE